MDHERLTDPVPRLCEYCYCPVLNPSTTTIYQGTPPGTEYDVTVGDWPGTHGIPVYFHLACYTAAKKLRRKNA